jgi:toxin CptA
MNRPTRLLLHIRSSRYVVALIVVTHALTAGLLLGLPVSLNLRLIGSAVVAGACAVALRRVVGRASPASLQIGLDRRIRITTRDGRQREGEVLADSYVGSRLTTIVWRPSGAWIARTVLILADTLPAEDFRQLRVILRYSRAPAPIAGSSDVDAA